MQSSGIIRETAYRLFLYIMRQFSAYRDKNWRVRLLRRVLDDLVRRTLFDDHAAVHENDPVGHISGKLHLVRHQ